MIGTTEQFWAALSKPLCLASCLAVVVFALLLFLNRRTRKQTLFSAVASLIACLVFFIVQFEIGIPTFRTIIVAFPEGTGEDDLRKSLDLIREDKHIFSNFDRVQLVEFGSPKTDVSTWTALDKLVATTGRLPRSFVAPKADETLVDVFKSLNRRFERTWRPWFQSRSVITLVNPSNSKEATWGGFKLPDASADLSSSFARPKINFFYLATENATQGALRLRFKKHKTVGPDQKLNGIYRYTVFFELIDVEGSPDQTIKLECQLVGNGRIFTRPAEDVQLNGFSSKFLIGSFDPGNGVLNSGIYQLNVTVTKDSSNEKFTSSEYLFVEERQLTIIHQPKISLNGVSNRLRFGENEFSWNEIAEEIDEAKDKPVEPYMSIPLPTENLEWPTSAEFVTHAFRDKLKREIDRSTCLILEEPTADQLMQLENVCGLSTQIRKRGLNVMIIGKPAVDDNSLPDWCHGFRKKAFPKHFVHGDPRVYFVPDVSRSMQVCRTGEKSGLKIQQDLINELVKKFKGKFLTTSDTPFFRIDRNKRYLATGNSGITVPSLVLSKKNLTSSSAGTVHEAEETLYSTIDTGPSAGDLLSIFPPVEAPYGLSPNHLAPFIALSPSEKPFETDLGLSAIRPRLSSLIGQPFSSTTSVAPSVPYSSPPNGSKWRTLNNLNATFTRTIVVLFVPAGVKVPLDIPASTVPTSTIFGAKPIEELQKCGVKFVVVKVAPNLSSLDAYNTMTVPAGEVSSFAVTDPLKYFETEINKTSNVAKEATKIKQRINSWMIPDRLQVGKSMGRDVDVRVSKNSFVPYTYLKGATSHPGPATPYTRLVAEAEHGPLLESRIIGQGRVHMLSYSPLSFDTWQRDVPGRRVIAKPDPAGGPPTTISLPFKLSNKMEGWGCQRIVDLMRAAEVEKVSNDTLRIFDISELEGRSGLIVDCWANLGSDGRWPILELEHHSTPTRTMRGQLVSVDPVNKRVRFVFRPTTRVRDPRARLTAVTPQRKTSRSIPVDLFPASSGDSYTSIFSLVAAFTSGRKLGFDSTTQSNEGEANVFNASMESTCLLASILPILAAFLVSPFCRSVSGFYALFVSRRMISFSREKPIERTAKTVVDAVMAQWGQHAGMPDASIHPGIAEGQRQYQSGDALSRCRPETLVSATSVGESMGLPMRRPIVRLRQATQPMHAHIIVDDGANLFWPLTASLEEKQTRYFELVLFVAQMIWKQSGQVSFSGLANGKHVSGPFYSNDSEGSLRAAFSQKLLKPNYQTFDLESATKDLQTGTTVFVLSSFSGYDTPALRAFVEKLTMNCNSVRLLQVVDDIEFRQTGLCKNARTGNVFDRGDVSFHQLEQSFLKFSDQVRLEIESRGGLYARLYANKSLVSQVDGILSQGVLK